MLQTIYCPIFKAKQPYHLKSVDMDFFSLEELFYFYTHNEILIDDSIMEEDFVYWVRESLGQQVLAEKLHQQIGAKCSLTMFLSTLLTQINTMEEPEKEEFLQRLSKMEDKNELQKRKILADQMAERGKYETAILEYRRILDGLTDPRQEADLLSSVWHNLGCCYGRMLEYDQALECFSTAYSYKPTQETRIAVASLQQLKDEERQQQSPDHGEESGQNAGIGTDAGRLTLFERTTQTRREARYQQLKERMQEYIRSTR